MVTLVTTLRRLMFLPAQQCKAHTGPSSRANGIKTIKTRSSPASGGAVPADAGFQAAATKLELQEQPLARCEVHVQRNRGLRLRAEAKSKGEGHLLGRGSNCFFGTGCNTNPPIIGGCIFPKAAGWAACDCAAAGWAVFGYCWICEYLALPMSRATSPARHSTGTFEARVTRSCTGMHGPR